MKHLLEMAQGNSLLGKINKKIKKKERISKKNNERYWKKLNASERLHYDSCRDRITKLYPFLEFKLTWMLFGIVFFSFAFLMIIKLLLNVNSSIFLNLFVSMVTLFILAFKIFISLDFFINFMNFRLHKRAIKNLNKRYGFN